MAFSIISKIKIIYRNLRFPFHLLSDDSFFQNFIYEHSQNHKVLQNLKVELLVDQKSS
jgi:hypothetical protein